MAWIVERDGMDPVPCATLDDAQQYVEDDAMCVWEALVDPNASRVRPVYPGLEWSWRNPENQQGDAVVERVAMLDSVEWRIRNDQ